MNAADAAVALETSRKLREVDGELVRLAPTDARVRVRLLGGSDEWWWRGHGGVGIRLIVKTGSMECDPVVQIWNPASLYRPSLPGFPDTPIMLDPTEGALDINIGGARPPLLRRSHCRSSA